GSLADRLRLRNRPVLRTLRTDARSPTCRLSKRTAGPRAGTDFMRRPGDAHRDLAVRVEHSLPLGRDVRPNCRTEKGGNAYAGYRHRRPPHLHRPVCLLCRVTAPCVAARETAIERGSEMTDTS